jgi:hypothetical protein
MKGKTYWRRRRKEKTSFRNWRKKKTYWKRRRKEKASRRK